MAESKGDQVVFVSNEQDKFSTSTEAAVISTLAADVLEDKREEDDAAIEISLPNVKTSILKKVVEFLEHHATEPMSEIEKPLQTANMADVVQAWYADFCKEEDETIFDLVLAANYMNIKPLLNLTCATVANRIKGTMSPDDIRSTFNGDSTSETTSPSKKKKRSDEPETTSVKKPR